MEVPRAPPHAVNGHQEREYLNAGAPVQQGPPGPLHLPGSEQEMPVQPAVKEPSSPQKSVSKMPVSFDEDNFDEEEGEAEQPINSYAGHGAVDNHSSGN